MCMQGTCKYFWLLFRKFRVPSAVITLIVTYQTKWNSCHGRKGLLFLSHNTQITQLVVFVQQQHFKNQFFGGYKNIYHFGNWLKDS